jgi:hypothetical protein
MTIRETSYPATYPRNDILAEWTNHFLKQFLVLSHTKRNNLIWWLESGENGNYLHVTQVSVERKNKEKEIVFKDWDTTDFPPFFNAPKKYIKQLNKPSYGGQHDKWLQTYKELNNKEPVKETPVEQKKETESKEITLDDVKNFLKNNDLDKDEQVELTESFSEYLNNTDNQEESVKMIKILLENVDESESQDIVDDINKTYPDIAFTTNLTDKVRDQFMDYFKENFDTTEFNDITANLINEAVNPQVVISDFLRLLNNFSLDELKKQLT